MAKSDTLKALSGLQLAYGRSLDKEQMLFYVSMLADIEPDLLEKAVKKIIMTSKLLPSIAEIREMATGLKKSVTGTRDPESGLAWGEVQKQIRATGYCGKPKFSSLLIMEAVNRLGWKDICSTPIEDTGILRAQFRRVYEEIVKQHKDDEINVFIGVIEAPEQKKIASNIQRLADSMSIDNN